MGSEIQISLAINRTFCYGNSCAEICHLSSRCPSAEGTPYMKGLFGGVPTLCKILCSQNLSRESTLGTKILWALTLSHLNKLSAGGLWDRFYCTV